MSTYAISDLHGNFNVYKKIKEFLKPEDKVIFLGDAADRGADGWRMIKEILDDPQWTYILGNHDVMLIDRFYHQQDGEYLHNLNGGKKTWKASCLDSEQAEYIYKLEASLYYAIYENTSGDRIFLSHSGYVPVDLANLTDYDKEDLVWDRSHFVNEDIRYFDKVVHGHTTIPHLLKFLRDIQIWEGKVSEESPLYWIPKYGAYWYCNNKKIDIDPLTVQNNVGLVFNLDTYESTVIEGDD